MTWLIGIGMAILAVLWLAAELTVTEEKGSGMKSFLKAYKKSIVFAFALFAMAGVLYYSFFN
ncbi:hypothetical protein [Alkalihalobacterium bogoriense]|uniref:hypothetical protein n=1 Tax=Alkalihalobacterium bogoriense TaxID=246272 RepID=UPI00047CED8D|nr:hypothetical protein [Alkalihalobacterium bogoriense]